MKKLLTTLAALIVIATPAFAQSFEPNLGTGNVQPISAEGTTVQVTRFLRIRTDTAPSQWSRVARRLPHQIDRR